LFLIELILFIFFIITIIWQIFDSDVTAALFIEQALISFMTLNGLYLIQAVLGDTGSGNDRSNIQIPPTPPSPAGMKNLGKDLNQGIGGTDEGFRRRNNNGKARKSSETSKGSRNKQQELNTQVGEEDEKKYRKTPMISSGLKAGVLVPDLNDGTEQQEFPPSVVMNATIPLNLLPAKFPAGSSSTLPITAPTTKSMINTEHPQEFAAITTTASPNGKSTSNDDSELEYSSASSSDIVGLKSKLKHSLPPVPQNTLNASMHEPDDDFVRYGVSVPIARDRRDLDSSTSSSATTTPGSSMPSSRVSSRRNLRGQASTGVLPQIPSAAVMGASRSNEDMYPAASTSPIEEESLRLALLKSGLVTSAPLSAHPLQQQSPSRPHFSSSTTTSTPSRSTNYNSQFYPRTPKNTMNASFTGTIDDDGHSEAGDQTSIPEDEYENSMLSDSTTPPYSNYNTVMGTRNQTTANTTTANSSRRPSVSFSLSTNLPPLPEHSSQEHEPTQSQNNQQQLQRTTTTASSSSSSSSTSSVSNLSVDPADIIRLALIQSGLIPISEGAISNRLLNKQHHQNQTPANSNNATQYSSSSASKSRRKNGSISPSYPLTPKNTRNGSVFEEDSADDDDDEHATSPTAHRHTSLHSLQPPTPPTLSRKSTATSTLSTQEATERLRQALIQSGLGFETLGKILSSHSSRDPRTPTNTQIDTQSHYDGEDYHTSQKDPGMESGDDGHRDEAKVAEIDIDLLRAALLQSGLVVPHRSASLGSSSRTPMNTRIDMEDLDEESSDEIISYEMDGDTAGERESELDIAEVLRAALLEARFDVRGGGIGGSGSFDAKTPMNTRMDPEEDA
jgi:hypothetical protein